MGFVDIMERAIGPIILVLGMVAMAYAFSQQTSYITVAREVYMEDTVYSQESQVQQDALYLTREELLAIIAAGPTCEMKIITISGNELSIRYNSNGIYQVEVLARGNLPDIKESVFSGDVQSFDDMPLQYLGFGSYRVSYEYSTDKLQQVIYREES